MNTFKEFFKANHDYSIFMEMAYRGHKIKKSIPIDNEDIDFLYQVDQLDWSNAMVARYEYLYECLKNRDNARIKVKKYIHKKIKDYFKHAGRVGALTGIIKDPNFKEKFKKIILEVIDNIDDYGNSGKGSFNKTKFLDWYDNNFDDYDIQGKIFKESGGRYLPSDVILAFKDFEYYILDSLVPFAKETKQNFQGQEINFYINRLIQKLETTEGKSFIGPTEYNPSYAPNIREVLPSDIIGKLKVDTKGRYGFDLSGVRSQIGKGEVIKGSPAFRIPAETTISNQIKSLLMWNFHRHFGPLPTDESLDSFKDKDVKYKIVRGKNKSGRAGAALKDDTLKVPKVTELTNNIISILGQCLNNDIKSWDDEKLNNIGSPNLKELFNSPELWRQATTGEWFKRYIGVDENDRLNNDAELRRIFDITLVQKNETGEKEEAWKIAKENPDWYSILKGTTYGGKGIGIAANSKLKISFAKYFAKEITKDYLKKERRLTPRVLAHDNDEFNSDDSHPRIDEKDLAEIKKILSPEDFETFKKTGSLPYDKAEKLAIGGNNAFAILPFIKRKIKDSEGKEREISVPILSPAVRTGAINFKQSEEEDEGEEEGEGEDLTNKERFELLKPITTSRGARLLKSIKELAELYESNPKQYQGTEAGAAVDAYKKGEKGYYWGTPSKFKSFSSPVENSLIPIEDHSSKRYPSESETRKGGNSVGAGFSQEAEGGRQISNVSKKARRRLSSIFGKVKKDDPRITHLIRGIPLEYFSEEPYEGWEPMEWSYFKAVYYGSGKSRKTSAEDGGDDEVNSSKSNKIEKYVRVNPGEPYEIAGYKEIIKGIIDCLTSGGGVCGTDIPGPVREIILKNDIVKEMGIDNPPIDDIHDKIALKMINTIKGNTAGDAVQRELATSSGRENFTKEKMATYFGRWTFTKSETGKLLQKGGKYGLKPRKSRDDLLGISYNIVYEDDKAETKPNQPKAKTPSDFSRSEVQKLLVWLDDKNQRYDSEVFKNIYMTKMSRVAKGGSKPEGNELEEIKKKCLNETYEKLKEDLPGEITNQLIPRSNIESQILEYKKGITKILKDNLLSKINSQKESIDRSLDEIKQETEFNTDLGKNLVEKGISIRKYISNYYYESLEVKLNDLEIIADKPQEELPKEKPEKILQIDLSKDHPENDRDFIMSSHSFEKIKNILENPILNISSPKALKALDNIVDAAMDIIKNDTIKLDSPEQDPDEKLDIILGSACNVLLRIFNLSTNQVGQVNSEDKVAATINTMIGNIKGKSGLDNPAVVGLMKEKLKLIISIRDEMNKISLNPKVQATLLPFIRTFSSALNKIQVYINKPKII